MATATAPQTQSRVTYSKRAMIAIAMKALGVDAKTSTMFNYIRAKFDVEIDLKYIASERAKLKERVTQELRETQEKQAAQEAQEEEETPIPPQPPPSPAPESQPHTNTVSEPPPRPDANGAMPSPAEERQRKVTRDAMELAADELLNNLACNDSPSLSVLVIKSLIVRWGYREVKTLVDLMKS